MQAFVFWSIGYYLVKYNIHLSYFDKYLKQLLFIFVCALIISFCFDQYVIFTLKRLFVIISVFLVIAVSSLFISNNHLLIFSKYNMIIYEFHHLPLVATGYVMAKILPDTELCCLIIIIFSSALVILFCIILGFLLKKYFPKVYSVVTGSR